jgi:hypothetical protein
MKIKKFSEEEISHLERYARDVISMLWDDVKYFETQRNKAKLEQVEGSNKVEVEIDLWFFEPEPPDLRMLANLMERLESGDKQ